MSQTVTLNGVNYEIPDVGEVGWGENVSNYLIALSTGTLTKAGGLFTLQSDVDFGATYGVAARYFRSRTGPTASTGAVRLNATDGIYWRNPGNTANLGLTVNASGELMFNGVLVALDVTPTASGVINVPSGNLTATNVQGALYELQGDIDTINTGYPAADAALQAQITANGGNLTAHIADTTTHGTTGDIVGTSDTQTLTNKTLSGASNTFTNIPLSALPQDINATANTLVQRNGAGSINAAGFIGSSINLTGSGLMVNLSLNGSLSASTMGARNAGEALSFTSKLVGADANSSFALATDASRTAGKLLSLKNLSTEKLAVDFDGAMTVTADIDPATPKSAFTLNIPQFQSSTSAALFTMLYGGMVNPVIKVDKDGSLNVTANVSASNMIAGNLFGLSSAQPVGLVGSYSNVSGAVGAQIAAGIPLTASGAKIASFRNGSTEKLAVDKDGNLIFSETDSFSYMGTYFASTATIDVSNGLDGYVNADAISAYGDGGGTAAYFYADVQIDGGDLYMNGRNINNIAAFVGTSTTPFLFTSTLGASATTPDFTINTSINRTATAGKFMSFKNFGTEKLAVTINGGLKLGSIGSSTGTPGNATLNNVAGVSSFATGASTLVITNSLVGTNSIVFAQLSQNDTTLTAVRSVVAGSGSFTITGNAAATAATTVRWYVLNVA